MSIAYLAIDPASTSGFAWCLDAEDQINYTSVDGLLSIPSCNPLMAFIEEIIVKKRQVIVTVEYLKGLRGASQVEYAGNQIIKWLHKVLPSKLMTINKITPAQWQCKITKGIEGETTKDRSKLVASQWVGQAVTSDDAADALCILRYSLSRPLLASKPPKTSKPRQKRK